LVKDRVPQNLSTIVEYFETVNSTKRLLTLGPITSKILENSTYLSKEK